MKTNYFYVSLTILIMSAFSAAQENPHKTVPFGCETCHITAEWDMIHFNHDTTGYMLVGKHTEIFCSDCHDIADFSRIDSDCRDCHTDVHQAKMYPDCERCHTPAGWELLDPYQAHANTTFMLLGSHAKLDCDACHKNEIINEFRRPSSDCYDCHRENYLNTSNPKHTSDVFGTRCDDCHSFIAWKPATFRDHDSSFPIFSGSHSGVWDACTTCHTNPATYSDFTCLVCHAHNQSSMDRRHRGKSGYSYESEACYHCHPRGSGE